MLGAIGYQNMLPLKMTIGGENVPPNIHLWHKDYFELIILRNSRHRRSTENKVKVIL